MTLSIIDYIVIGVILISALIGIKKGFVKVLFSLIRKFASFFIALFLVKPVRSFLRTTVVNDKIYGFFLNWVNGKGEQFSQPVPEGGMSEALKESLNLPKFLCDLLSKVIGDGSSTEGMTLGEVFSETLTYYVLTIVAFILLLIVASIVIALLSSGLIQFFINRFDNKNDKLDKIIAEQKKNEKDQLRTQLLVMMTLMPNSHEEIMQLAERYFKELKGDWFYSSLFAKWIKENKIEKPLWFQS